MYVALNSLGADQKSNNNNIQVYYRYIILINIFIYCIILGICSIEMPHDSYNYNTDHEIISKSCIRLVFYVPV